VEGVEWFTPPAFQTLIGTVKSYIGIAENIGPTLFQTLIGTVKSLRDTHLHHLPHHVSNPHRYGQKELAVRLAATM
jgi:hypothetical protein